MILMNPTTAETTLELRYPAARQVDQTDDYFGTTVSDPYRWMEDVDSAGDPEYVGDGIFNTFATPLNN